MKSKKTITILNSNKDIFSKEPNRKPTFQTFINNTKLSSKYSEPSRNILYINQSTNDKEISNNDMKLSISLGINAQNHNETEKHNENNRKINEINKKMKESNEKNKETIVDGNEYQYSQEEKKKLKEITFEIDLISSKIYSIMNVIHNKFHENHQENDIEYNISNTEISKSILDKVLSKTILNEVKNKKIANSNSKKTNLIMNKLNNSKSDNYFKLPKIMYNADEELVKKLKFMKNENENKEGSKVKGKVVISEKYFQKEKEKDNDIVHYKDSRNNINDLSFDMIQNNEDGIKNKFNKIKFSPIKKKENIKPNVSSKNIKLVSFNKIFISNIEEDSMNRINSNLNISPKNVNLTIKPNFPINQNVINTSNEKRKLSNLSKIHENNESISKKESMLNIMNDFSKITLFNTNINQRNNKNDLSNLNTSPQILPSPNSSPRLKQSQKKTDFKIFLPFLNENNKENEVKSDEEFNKDKKNIYEEAKEKELKELIEEYKKLEKRYNNLSHGMERINRDYNEFKMEMTALENIIAKEKNLFEEEDERKTKKYYKLPVNSRLKQKNNNSMVNNSDYGRDNQNQMNISPINKSRKNQNDLSNLNNFQLNSKEINQINQTNQINNTIANTSQISKENVLIKKTEQRKKINKFIEECNFLKTHIKINQFLKESFKSDINSLLYKMNILKHQINDHKKVLEIHYHNLLIEGIDTRTKGLSWILIAIWNLGCEVLMSYLPSFLDNHLISFLFVKSHLQIELIKTEIIINELKSMVKVNRGKEYRKIKQSLKMKFTQAEIRFSLVSLRSNRNFIKRKSDFIYGDMNNIIGNDKQLYDNITNSNCNKNMYSFMIQRNNKRKQRSLKKDIYYSKYKSFDRSDDVLYSKEALPEIDKLVLTDIDQIPINVNKLNKFFEDRHVEYIDNNTNMLVNQVDRIEKLKNKIENEILYITDKEIMRITKEFLTNEYERVYKANIETILSSIVGFNNLRQAMKKFQIEKKNYLFSIKLCRNFNLEKKTVSMILENESSEEEDNIGRNRINHIFK